jgi:hypothetical protein
MAIRLINHRYFLLILAFAIMAIIISCANTSLKYFFTEGNKNPQIIFQGYKIDIHVSATATLGSPSVDSFTLSIKTEFLNELKDTSFIDSIGLLQLDCIYIEIPHSHTVIKPELAERGLGSRFIRGRHLFGPMYLFMDIFLPDEIQNINLHFKAHLYDRKSGIELTNSNFKILLHRVEKKHFYLSD